MSDLELREAYKNSLLEKETGKIPELEEANRVIQNMTQENREYWGDFYTSLKKLQLRKRRVMEGKAENTNRV